MRYGDRVQLERVRQQHAHAVHTMRHPTQLAAPLRKERRVAEYLPAGGEGRAASGGCRDRRCRGGERLGRKACAYSPGWRCEDALLAPSRRLAPAACAVQRRRRVGGAHDGLLDGAQHRLRLFARRAHEVDRANPLAV